MGRLTVAILLAALMSDASSAGEGPAPAKPVGESVTPAAKTRRPVVGLATIEGEAKKATVTWTYEKAGAQVKSEKPPKMRISRIGTSVAKLLVKLPTDIFAIKIGPDMQRIFDEPILLDSDQKVVCSCRMRSDCGQGGPFRCEVEGELAD